MSDCAHIVTVPPRRCLECGGVRCCDDSPHQHASRHAGDSEHVLMQSFEPGEDWIYCFADEVTLELPGAANSPSYDG